MQKTGQIAYLNGEFIPIEKAQISPQDRGFLFGDGVYEVIPVYGKKLFTFQDHLERLKNSLKATSILNPLEDDAWERLLQKLVDMHPWKNQYIYLQVTRGVQMQRDHLPADCLSPTLYAYTNELKPVSEAIINQGIKAVTLDDIRWLRCDIKAITLLPNIMMKMAAKNQGADDAILIDRDGLVAEGTSNNVFIVKNDALFTPKNGSRILPGITRSVIQSLAEQHSLPLSETDITLSDLENADEIWLTSSTKDALPVTELNGHLIGQGKPGPVWQKIQQYFEETKQQFIQQLT
ncbi:D-alanine aminotransferase [Hydrogenovibrio crunogenus]|uniref:Aminodeoxychorismate lyase n=1 Tax=Hydrogenovibrio crunogenus TaxID=39765 RepID=A0A4P7P0W2_9GAMM|nr:D-amino acid aminotransferase [Hydrogenovibrio crunogenus]QBZ83668.1 D-alanine aminotransferase [Hydrogenovibrio crunogenus]RUM92351.1 MAG: D-amino acid aminotransferase [Thiomicrospira sp.]